jgi:hypothetical protein
LFLTTNVKVEAQPIITDSIQFVSEVFLQKISTLLTKNSSKTQQKKSEELLNIFHDNWIGGNFSENEKRLIKKVVDTLQDKKIPNYPYLFQYINTLNKIAGSALSEQSKIYWQKFIIEKIITAKRSDFLQFCKDTEKLLDFKLLNVINNNYLWEFSSATYKFEYDNYFKIKFEKLNLICSSKRDKSTIYNTSGIFNYETKQWTGNGGTVKWERFGEETGKEIYSVFDKYSIDLTKAYYIIDSARLNYKTFFKNPLLGMLKDKVTSSPPTKETRFPEFEVYEKGIELEDIYPDFKLKCNLKVEGEKLYAYTDDNNKATAYIKKNDTVYAKFSSLSFLLHKNYIESPHSEFTFYLDKDSIYHPDLNFRFKDDEKSVMLFADSYGTDNVIPFTDTYHQMDLYVPVFYWDMDNDKIYLQRFKQFRGDYKAAFESINYYSAQDFYDLQIMNQKNPLYLIEKFLKEYNADDNIIEVPLLASYLRKPEEQIVKLLIDLSIKGFVIYDPLSRKAVVKHKLFHFLRAKRGLADYDVIKLESKVSKGANGVINLNTLDLKVFGLPEIVLSDSQSVYLYPKKQNVSIKKNRDFSFDGLIQVGLLDFYVNNSIFVYDSFLINLNYIDSMAFYTVEKDPMKANKYNLSKVDNVITQMIGKLYIDEPGNKSGVFNFPKYPIFTNKDNGFVYYNKPEIQDSTLTPDKLFYRVDPFVFDSVSQFLTNGLAFKGCLVTDSIFPEIEVPLTIMPDKSLGFVYHTPDTGCALYGGKGRFFNEITLDNNGLKGNGRIDFVNSTFNSNDITFYPDSLKTTANNFANSGNKNFKDFPDITGDSINIQWLVSDTNIMTASVLDKNKPFKMFGNSTFKGTLFLSPEFIKGTGDFKFETADIFSENIDFKNMSMSADSADFTLFDESGKNKMFISKGYFVNIDFENSVGKFKLLNKEKGSFVEFPYNQYVSTLNELHWLMNEKKLILTSSQSKEIKILDSLTVREAINKNFDLGEFISINPEQDSLRFYAEKGEYDYNSYNLIAEGVRFIKTGDAAVFPVNKMVKIKRDAFMDTIYKAVIITDTANMFHKIYDATVNIESKNKFTAEGFVDYYDRNNLPQQVYLNNIETNSWGKSVGHGKIEAGDYFFLSPEYFYKGDVTLISTERYLKFKGGFRINEECIGQEDQWVAFERFINPRHVNFEITENTMTSDSVRARFGLAFSFKKNIFYPMVFRPKESVADFVCIESYGHLDYDTLNNSFRVGSQMRLEGDKLAKGSFVELDNKHCILRGDGILKLKTKFYRIGLNAAGKFKHLIIPDSTYFNTALILDFMFDEELLNMMSDSLRMASGKTVNVEKSPFMIAMREYSDKETINKLLVEMNLYGQFNDAPQQLKGTITFTDVKLRWDSYSKSYISEGKLGIGFLNDKTVNKYVDGYMQIQLSRSGSYIHFYLKPTGKSWYYFSYGNGIMQAISSDMNFNIMLSDIPEGKRVKHPDNDEEYYEYVISTKRRMVDFLRRIDKINKMR